MSNRFEIKIREILDRNLTLEYFDFYDDTPEIRYNKVPARITDFIIEERKAAKKQRDVVVNKLLNALIEIEAAQKAEEDYRWEHIGSYPDIPVTDEVRTKWLDDLKVISNRKFKARKNAQRIIAQMTKEK